MHIPELVRRWEKSVQIMRRGLKIDRRRVIAGSEFRCGWRSREGCRGSQIVARCVLRCYYVAEDVASIADSRVWPHP